MKAYTKTAVASVVALMLTAGTLTSFAQPQKSSKADETKKATSKFHRLPAYYGKLELKEEQIEEIYSIRETFGKKIEALQKELADLREEQAEKTKDVLTRTQVTAYNKLIAAAESGKKSSSDEKDSSTKKSSSSKKPSSSKKE